MFSYYKLNSKTNQNHKFQNKAHYLTVSQQSQLKQAISKNEFDHIQILNMKNANIGDHTLSLLWTIKPSNQLSTRHLPLLQINLSENFSFITDKSVQSLIECTDIFINLSKINLGDNAITDKSIQLLSKSSFNNLKQLKLYGNSDITSMSLFFLSKSTSITNLEILDFHATSINDEGIECFFKSVNCRDLIQINLSMNWDRITDNSLYAMSHSQCSKKLIALELQDCSITDQGIRDIVDSQNFINLSVLNLNNSIENKNKIKIKNRITDQGLKSLAYAHKLTNLKTLELRNTQITSKGLKTLSVSLSCQKLEKLRLSHCPQIREESILHLETIIGYMSLKKVYINSTSIKQEQCQKLQKKHPQVHIIY